MCVCVWRGGGVSMHNYVLYTGTENPAFRTTLSQGKRVAIEQLANSSKKCSFLILLHHFSYHWQSGAVGEGEVAL